MTTKSKRNPILRKRGLRAALALGLGAALSLGASGCSSSSTGAGGGQIVVYTYGDNSTNIQQAAVDAFNKTSTVKVKLVQVPGNDYSPKLRTVMTSSSAPDVFFNWGGGSIAPYVKANELVDLTPYFNQAPLKGAFLPSVVAAGAVDGKDYGVPMRGMQPVILFYNKTLFAQYNLQPPNTWAAMQAAITTFKAHGVIPFALGGADNWPDLMWLEYMLDRVGGSGEFTKIQNGDSSGWTDQAMTTSLTDIQQLIQEGAFGTKFTSTSYTNNAAPALLGSGKAAMQLMGSWDYANQLSNYPNFAKSEEGFTTFPDVAGGTGNPADVVGNPTNFWSINAKTKYLSTAVAFVQYMASDTYTKALLAGGWIPTATTTSSLLSSYPNPAFGQFQYQMVQQAPSFQLSWDQALPTAVGTPLDTEVGKFFAGQVSVSQFESDMQTTQKNAGS
ncbi:extracellular solute-binding protein [Actinospica durhamensis]|uniref:extracellular solute-binding protein n=1 Tax=Actinospica durhamensis TaxID=1508375 RepID=UPI0027DCD55C|nr:extracellular solute-binding protein [Actinospica durhamensis]